MRTGIHGHHRAHGQAGPKRAVRATGTLGCNAFEGRERIEAGDRHLGRRQAGHRDAPGLIGRVRPIRHRECRPANLLTARLVGFKRRPRVERHRRHGMIGKQFRGGRLLGPIGGQLRIDPDLLDRAEERELRLGNQGLNPRRGPFDPRLDAPARRHLNGGGRGLRGREPLGARLLGRALQVRLLVRHLRGPPVGQHHRVLPVARLGIAQIGDRQIETLLQQIGIADVVERLGRLRIGRQGALVIPGRKIVAAQPVVARRQAVERFDRSGFAPYHRLEVIHRQAEPPGVEVELAALVGRQIDKFAPAHRPAEAPAERQAGEKRCNRKALRHRLSPLNAARAVSPLTQSGNDNPKDRQHAGQQDGREHHR